MPTHFTTECLAVQLRHSRCEFILESNWALTLSIIEVLKGVKDVAVQILQTAVCCWILCAGV